MTRDYTEKIFPVKAIGICTLYLLLACVACHSTDEPTPSVSTTEGPDQEGWNSKITVTSNGRTAALVQYSHMEKYSKKRHVQFEGGIVVDFYNNKGEHTSHLTADKGLLFEDTNDVEARENVIAKSDSGITLRSQSLKWLNRTQKIITDDFVTITTQQGDTLRGKGFESDSRLMNYVIKKPSGVTHKRFELPKNTRSPSAPTASPDSSDND